MNSLELDPEQAAALGECEDGETKTIQVTGTVRRGEDGSLTLEGVYDATAAGDDPEYEEEEEKPKHHGKTKMPPALAIVVKPAKGK